MATLTEMITELYTTEDPDKRARISNRIIEECGSLEQAAKVAVEIFQDEPKNENQ